MTTSARSVRWELLRDDRGMIHQGRVFHVCRVASRAVRKSVTPRNPRIPAQVIPQSHTLAWVCIRRSADRRVGLRAHRPQHPCAFPLAWNAWSTHPPSPSPESNPAAHPCGWNGRAQSVSSVRGITRHEPQSAPPWPCSRGCSIPAPQARGASTRWPRGSTPPHSRAESGRTLDESHPRGVRHPGRY